MYRQLVDRKVHAKLLVDFPWTKFRWQPAWFKPFL